MKTRLLIFTIVLLLQMQLVYAQPVPEPEPVCKEETILINGACVSTDGPVCGLGTTYQDGICVVDETENSTKISTDPSKRWGSPYTYDVESPLKQIKSGVSLIDVTCNEGKVKVIKYNKMMVACVNGNAEAETKLIDRGWALLRFAMPEMTISEINHLLCNSYKGKWHPEYDGCRDITDLQCSLMGGEFVDNLKICYDGICPMDKTYTLCVTNSDLISGK